MMHPYRANGNLREQSQMPNLLGVPCGHPYCMGINRSLGDVEIHPEFIKKRTFTNFLKRNNVRINLFQYRAQGPLFLFRFRIVPHPLPFHNPIHDQVVLQVERSYANFLRRQRKAKGKAWDCLEQSK